MMTSLAALWRREEPLTRTPDAGGRRPWGFAVMARGDGMSLEKVVCGGSLQQNSWKARLAGKIRGRCVWWSVAFQTAACRDGFQLLLCVAWRGGQRRPPSRRSLR